MDRKKLLIAEGTEDFRAALTDSLRGAFHLRECGDGNLAMEMLRRFQPDILVLDLMLPGLDGISLLQMAAAAGIRPMVLATTRFVSDYVLEAIEPASSGAPCRCLPGEKGRWRCPGHGIPY